MNTSASPVLQAPPPPPQGNRWVWWAVGGLILFCLLVTCCGAVFGGYYLYSQGKLPGFGSLDPAAAPSSGSVSLETGFLPDPYTAQVTGGGTLNGLNLDLQGATDCVGYYSQEPTFSLDWVGGSSYTLRMFAVEENGRDATMVVRDPQGNYFCNDDAGDGGPDPLVILPVSLTGQYDVWLGSYSQDGQISATLYISELDYSPRDLPGSSSGGDGTLDPDAYPLFGSTALDSGFVPDPFTYYLTAGGEQDAYSAVSSASCTGYATLEPTYQIEWSGNSDRLRFFFVADDGDTTLIIQDPNGSWSCNDDSGYGGLDPLVQYDDPPAGRYSIWVGSYSYGDEIFGSLYVTEGDLNPSDYSSSGSSGGYGEGLDYALETNYGSETIGDTSALETFQLSMASGGSVYVPDLDLGPGCAGHVTSAPDFEIFYQGDAARLRIFFVAQDGSDTTLVVNSSRGEWVCNDDSDYSRDPLVEFSNPSSGTYDIWVGTYGSTSTVQGTLYITEGDYGPGQLP